MGQKKESKFKELLEMNKEILSKFFSVILFSGCLIYVAYQGSRCIEKFYGNPQRIEVSYQHFSRYKFPSFTFCPTSQTDVYDNQILKTCNLTIDKYLHDGPWVSSYENCTNSTELYQRLVPDVG